jgi:hypothetical protein
MVTVTSLRLEFVSVTVNLNTPLVPDPAPVLDIVALAVVDPAVMLPVPETLVQE